MRRTVGVTIRYPRPLECWCKGQRSRRRYRSASRHATACTAIGIQPRASETPFGMSWCRRRPWVWTTRRPGSSGITRERALISNGRVLRRVTHLLRSALSALLGFSGALVVAVDRPLGGDANYRGRHLGFGSFRDRRSRSGGCGQEPDSPGGTVCRRFAGMRGPVGGRHILGAGHSAGRFHRVGAVGCHRHRSVAAGGDRVADAASSGATVVVVGVDDVHRLDDLSTFVVHQIVQRGAAKVILTVRDGEPIPAAVQEIWNVGQFDRLDMQPLSVEETTTLLSATLAGSVDPDAAQRLWKLTRGNVLYLRNIVEQEVADGRIVQQHGYWRWIGDPIMPPGLVELIESRMGALPTPVSDVIDALAVGEPIELAALTRITDPAAVEEADTRGLITLEPVSGGVEVRVAHPLYGEVRRRRAAPTRLRRLRGLVAAELAASDDRDDMRVVVRRAALSLDSDLTPDSDLLVQGGPRRRLAGGSAPRRSTRGSGNPRRSGTGSELCSRACTFVAGPWRGGRRGARRDSHQPVDRRTTTPDSRSCGPATCSGRLLTPRARKNSSTTRRAPHLRRLAAISTPSSRCTGLRWISRMRRRKRRKTSHWTTCPPSLAPR